MSDHLHFCKAEPNLNLSDINFCVLVLAMPFSTRLKHSVTSTFFFPSKWRRLYCIYQVPPPPYSFQINSNDLDISWQVIFSKHQSHIADFSCIQCCIKPWKWRYQKKRVFLNWTQQCHMREKNSSHYIFLVLCSYSCGLKPLFTIAPFGKSELYLHNTLYFLSRYSIVIWKQGLLL